MTKKLLMVFIRNPELGKVKTRLAKQTSDETALAIYNELLLHTNNITKGLGFDKWVFYTNKITHNDIWNTGAFEKKIQSEGDLGNKMYQAFRQGFEAGYKQIVIIGSDIEQLTQEIIETAFIQLENQTVIGPAEDGGYYLLGLNSLRKDVFESKIWGTNTVLRDTLTDLKNEQVHQLTLLNDIDVLDDIKPDSDLYKYI